MPPRSARVRPGLLLACVLLVAACNVVAPGGGKGPGAATPKPTKAPGGKPSPTPAGSATPKGVATAAPPDLLLKPPAGTLALAGEVSIEASFAFMQGGRLIGDAGSGILTDAGGGLIGDAGSGLIGKVKSPSLIGDAGSGLIGKVKSPLIGDAGSGLIGDAGSGLVSDNGAAIAVGGLRVDGGRLLAADGRLIATGQGNVVATTAGGLAPALDDGTLLAGAGILSNNGGSLIGDAGSGLIGDAGSGLISDNGASYRLAQAAASASPGPASAVGVRLPAGGIAVAVVSLATREYVPLGLDAKGQPVYAVYADAFGRFQVHVPADLRDNVVVVATIPGSRDPRGTYDILPAAQKDELALDDLNRLMARYIRRSFTGRVASTLKRPDLSLFVLEPEASFQGSSADPATPKGQVAALIRMLGELAAEAGIDDASPDRPVTRKAQRIVDLALAKIDLDRLQITFEDVNSWRLGMGPRPPERALDVYRRALLVLADGATKKLRQAPGFFNQSYLSTVINARNGGDMPPLLEDWTDRVKTPADVGEFMLTEYFGAVRTNGTAPLERLFRVFYEVRGEGEQAVFEKAEDTKDEILAAGNTTTIEIARVLLQPEMKERVRQILAEPDPPAP